MQVKFIEEFEFNEADGDTISVEDGEILVSKTHIADARFLKLGFQSYERGKDSYKDFVIDIEEKKIIAGNIKGQGNSFYVKVKDSGCYTLYDKDLNRIPAYCMYAPVNLFGSKNNDSDIDYLLLEFDGDGRITSFPENPNLSDFNSHEKEY